jgi:Trypsin
VLQGDAGAALICDDEVYAIYSRGIDCDTRKAHVGFYVRIEFVRAWIAEATNNELK